MKHVYILLPAYNESESIAFTLQGIHDTMQKYSFLYTVVVCDNNSSDTTKFIAEENNAVVVVETKKGYGNTLMRGIGYVTKNFVEIPPREKILVFMDADGQDDETKIFEHIKNLETVDFSIASRTGRRVNTKKNLDAESIVHTWVNILFGYLLLLRTGKKFSDLGPFRALTLKTFLALDMQDYTYGWTAEMQKKIVLKNFSFQEFYTLPKKRFGGTSKVSGSTKWHQVRIGLHIIWRIFF